MRHSLRVGLLLGPLCLAAISGCNNDDTAAAMPDLGAPPDLLPGEDLNVPKRDPDPIPMEALRNRVLPSVELVTVTFQDYVYAKEMEALGDYVMTSDWMKEVGADYGVGVGKHLAKVRLPEPVPANTTDAKMVALIKRYVEMGVLPAPPPKSLSNILYMMYFPAKTVLDSEGSKLCDDFEGYHSALAFPDGSKATYAIIGDCEINIGDITNTATHELIEAASDPWLDSWMVVARAPNHWAIEDGMENADLCWNAPSVVQGGFALARVWSPSAAASLKEPCIPAASTNFETVVPTPAQAPVAMPGQKLTYILTGWSSTPSQAPWKLQWTDADYSDFSVKQLAPELSSLTVAHGQSVKLTLTVPPSANPGSLGGLLILSGDEVHMAAVAFTTP